ncbi:MAG: tannase/feruloyl esterase family alpha/beta hydrolase, partial [Gammaproteobacteria bacterium]|nr:tannase/feruloyl esterase family alpha/beta hydrolase [Gammaproteobacteria bacterium]
MRSISWVTAGITVSTFALGAGQSNAEEACADLASFTLQDLRIKATEKVDAGTPHCKVAGVIEKEINFELLLPDDWNGRFMMGGGGAYVGSIQNQALAYGSGPGALERGYATVGTDTGHVSSMVDGSWALNNVERQENFGHRAVHLTAVAAKAIIERYYARAPEYSYFVGCSRGGGQAMMETQRYP